MSAYSHLDSFHGDDPKAWLVTIAANKCRDFLKSPARKTGTLTDEELGCIRDGSPLPEDAIANRDKERHIEGLCLKLKEPYRTTALNYFCRSLKLSEVSKATGQNLKTLETQLYRAKKCLKALWEEEQRQYERTFNIR